jgi:hypothetical protein
MGFSIINDPFWGTAILGNLHIGIFGGSAHNHDLFLGVLSHPSMFACLWHQLNKHLPGFVLETCQDPLTLMVVNDPIIQ